jgi:hypothetical protein
MDLTRSDKMIVDVVQIYNVAKVSGREPESCISICSSADGMKCALLINDYPHAAFTAKRGYCRANLPNLPNARRAATTAPIITGRTMRLRG